MFKFFSFYFSMTKILIILTILGGICAVFCCNELEKQEKRDPSLVFAWVISTCLCIVSLIGLILEI